MDNLRGAFFMVLAMAGFAVEDALIKSLSGAIPPGQVIAIIGGGATLLFCAWFALRGQPLWIPQYADPRVMARTGLEVAGSLLFVSALALIPLTTASAVIQATPLVVAMGAALFLGQTVGWRRWLAILVGFAGVLLIIRPGAAGFSGYTLLAVGGMFGLAMRDLVTRKLDLPISGARLSTHAFAALLPAGLLLCLLQGAPLVMPTAFATLMLCASVIVGIGSYLAIVAATRRGDAAIISSFRYSRMVFALIVGFIAFGEQPDTMTLIGVTIVIGAGLFTLMREARLRHASKALTPAL